jgi:hypothetical protein
MKDLRVRQDRTQECSLWKPRASIIAKEENEFTVGVQSESSHTGETGVHLTKKVALGQGKDAVDGHQHRVTLPTQFL